MEIISLGSDDAKPKAPPVKNPKKNQITDLKPAVHHENRVNVFIDDEFSFSLDVSQVVDFRLKKGQILTESKIADLKHASVFGKLYAQTLEWVLMRPRSVKETRDHLTLKLKKMTIDNLRRAENRERLKTDPGFKKLVRDFKIKTKNRELFTEEDIEAVIKKLIDKQYLDDSKFAAWFVENKFALKGVSKTRLRQELVKKGIDASLIDELLENTPRSEAEEIKKVIKKKGPRLDSEKLFAYLARHGFSFDLSRSLVEEYYSDPESFFDE